MPRTLQKVGPCLYKIVEAGSWVRSSSPPGSRLPTGAVSSTNCRVRTGLARPGGHYYVCTAVTRQTYFYYGSRHHPPLETGCQQQWLEAKQQHHDLYHQQSQAIKNELDDIISDWNSSLNISLPCANTVKHIDICFHGEDFLCKNRLIFGNFLNILYSQSPTPPLNPHFRRKKNNLQCSGWP